MSKKDIKTTLELLDAEQAGKYLGVNVGTIRRWAQNQQLEGIKVGIRGDWRFNKDQLLKMARNNNPDENIELTQLAVGSLSIHQQLIANSTHSVQIYEDDQYLINSICDYIKSGDRAIIIATKDHRDLLEGQLQENGINITSLKSKDLYIFLDAFETLSKFMVDDMPDPEKFFKVIGGLISQSVDGNRVVRAFGEMVAILWENDNQAGAIRLEQLWNDLQKILPFSLFCAYPISMLGGEEKTSLFSEVCLHHTSVLPAESYSKLQNTDEQFRIIAKLQQKAKSLEEEIEKRKKLERQKDEFISIASHELRTPLTTLKGYTQILQNSLHNEKQAKHYLTKMNSQLDRLNTLVNDLLDVSKIQSGKLVIKKEKINLRDLLEETAEDIQQLSSHHKIHVDSDKIIEVLADKHRLNQVIINLLFNAIKFSPKSNIIKVLVRSSKTDVTVSIQDFGIGITRSNIEKIFEPFYQASTNIRQSFQGMGLGLHISSEIIKRHGGEIWVESNKNQGSTFYFKIPQK